MEEKEYQVIKDENKALIDEFETYLKEKKLSEKTIRKHLNNAHFYLDGFLLEANEVSAEAEAGYAQYY